MNCDMDVLKVLAQRGLFRTLFVAQLLVVTLAKAETQNIDGRTWTYSVSNGEATITKAPEGTKDLIIPSALGGFPVVRIGSWAMGYYNWLSSPIVIPEGVRSIGDGAFAYCTWLPSVSIPSTVTNIEENAFYSCNKMTSVYIANLTKWCAISFGARSANPLCENNRTELYVKGELVRDLVIPYGVKRVNDYAFCGWDKSVKIPESVVSIGKEAFSWNKGLVEVVIPSSVTNIDMTAFAQCTGLEKIYVEESNITYSSYDGMMYDKEGATLKLCPEGRRGVVTIPDGVREIGRETFGDCAQITAVYMPLSMRRIGEYAFYGCDGLTSITIPVGVTTIDRWAFQGCDNLMSVSIPSTVKDVGIDAFSNWSALKTIYVEADDVDRIVLLLTASGLDLTKVEIIPVACRTITFDATGGSVECCQMSVVEGSVLGELPMAEREGWMFLGWFTTAIGGMNVSSDSVVTSDLILYAHWQVRVYKVTLNLNYENKHEEHMREYGSCIGDLGIPQRPGYTFAGWFTEANGGSAISSDLVVTDEVVCYAHWVVNTYYVVFNMNYEGGENKRVEYTYGTNLGALEFPKREGYKFLGWFTDPEGGEQVFPGTIVISDTMYYARWVDEEMNTIRLNLCYDEKDFDVILREHNTKIGALPFPQREGYVFLGWFANDTDTESVSCETVVTSDMELYARWEAIVGDWFMITLNAEGGVLSFEMFQVESKIMALPVPVRYGYEFLGWSTREVAGEIIGCGGPCEPFAVTEDMTLYAYWRPMYYKLCLASDIIGVPADMCSYQIGQDVKLSNPFHNPGYTFLGWGLDYKKNGGQVVYVEDQVVPSLSDVEGQRVWLYAIWGEPEPLDFPTALNVDCSLTWTTGGKAGWKAMATDVACDGISCARSGDISSYENSWVETTVEGAGTLEFSWKNSCKTDDDSFGLIIDGKLQGSCYGGNARWQKMTVKLGKGTHTLRWVYERGYSYGSAATGYGYIDNVMWVPATTYYIEFVANGGKGTMECQEMVSNLEAKLNLNSFVKEDCHFCGWALNSDGIVVYGDGQSVCGLNPDENGIVRLYAIWEPSYSFTFRSLDATSVEVTGMSVSGQMSGRIVIPERINDKNVVKIGASAFSGRNEIYSVSIPATVNKIGSSAFSGCVNLRSVSLEEGVVEIADLAFSQCASLQYVNIPLSVETIGCSAFKGCAGLGDGVVVVDDCVLTVNGECPTDVRLPSNVRILTSGTFMSCESLASITIPPGIDNLGMRTFAWCSKLGFVALPSTITNLDFMAFSCCSSLKSITIPSSVVTIGEAAFMLCGALEKIIIQGGVERISEQAFLDCLALTEITLPKSVRFVGRDAFNGCSSMKIVWVEKGDVKRMRDLLGGSGLRVDSIEFQECEEPIPDLPTSASAGDVANALKGSCDDRLMANVTDAVMYEKYRAWALKIGAGAVKNSENAWVSFAVDSDALLEKSPVDEDLAIEEFKPTDETGRFDFTVRVKDIEIGSGALADNLKKVFGLTGATTLDAGAFKHENVDVEFDTPKDGVLKFTAKPAKVSDRFFMRVKVK